MAGAARSRLLRAGRYSGWPIAPCRQAMAVAPGLRLRDLSSGACLAPGRIRRLRRLLPLSNPLGAVSIRFGYLPIKASVSAFHAAAAIH